MAQLETERLILRRLVADDLDSYHNAVYGDADVMRYLPGGVPRPRERTAKLIEEFNVHWEQHNFGAWAIVLKADDQVIGHCGLQYIPDSTDVELFYAIGKAWWGQGYTSEASRAALRYGFEVCGLAQIYALAVPENTASRRVMEKVGMTYQGSTERYYNAELALYVISKEAFQEAE